jgi:hypothetical protein
MELDFVKIAAVIRDLGVGGGLILLLWGGYKRRWVWGWQLEELRHDMKAQLDACEHRAKEWKDLALTGRTITRDVVELAKRQQS